jgi:hypothetical protein
MTNTNYNNNISNYLTISSYNYNIQNYVTSASLVNSLNNFAPSVLSISSNVYVNSVTTKGNIATGNNIGVGNICSVGALDCLTSVNCDSIKVNNGCDYNFKTIGYITVNTNNLTFSPLLTFVPLCKSILNPASYCGSINLVNLLYDSYAYSLYIYLYPTYKMVVYNIHSKICYTLDNTNGGDIVYVSLENEVFDSVQSIIFYCNNIPIL